MKPIVVDTDVVSFLFKNDSREQSYLSHLYDRQWLISFMTEAARPNVCFLTAFASETRAIFPIAALDS